MLELVEQIEAELQRLKTLAGPESVAKLEGLVARLPKAPPSVATPPAAPPPAAPPPPPPAAKKNAMSALLASIRKDGGAAPAPKPSGKAPPPQKKAPPVRKAPPAPETHLELIPSVLPPANATPRPINWYGIAKTRVPGTIWEKMHKPENKLRPDTSDQSTTDRSTLSSSAGPTPLTSILAAPAGAPRAALPPGSTGPPAPDPVHLLVPKYSELNELFFESEEALKKAEEEKAKQKDKQAEEQKSRQKRTVLDGDKRIQDIEIAMKGLGVIEDFTVIRKALAEWRFTDVNHPPEQPAPPSRIPTGVGEPEADPASLKWSLSPYKVERLLSIYPTDEEVTKLEELRKEFAGKEQEIPKRVAAADRFLLALVDIDGFKNLAKAILLYYSFLRFVSNVPAKLEKFESVCHTLLKLSEHPFGALYCVLSLIIRIGNYVNYRSRRPLVYGIQITCLETLKSVKSKKSFLRLVAEHIEDQQPKLWDQLLSLPQCLDASEVVIDDISAQIREVQNGLKSLENETAFDAATFHSSASTILTKVTAKLDTCKTLLRSAVTRFGERDNTPVAEQLAVLKHIGQFGKDLLTARRELLLQKENNEKRKQREMMKASTPSRRMASRHHFDDDAAHRRLSGVVSLVNSRPLSAGAPEQRSLTPFGRRRRQPQSPPANPPQVARYDLRPTADLRSAGDLRPATDPRGADLRAAELRAADLRAAELRAADLRAAELRAADLRSMNGSDKRSTGGDLRSACDLRSGPGSAHVGRVTTMNPLSAISAVSAMNTRRKPAAPMTPPAPMATPPPPYLEQPRYQRQQTGRFDRPPRVAFNQPADSPPLRWSPSGYLDRYSNFPGGGDWHYYGGRGGGRY